MFFKSSYINFIFIFRFNFDFYYFNNKIFTIIKIKNNNNKFINIKNILNNYQKENV